MATSTIFYNATIKDRDAAEKFVNAISEIPEETKRPDVHFVTNHQELKKLFEGMVKGNA